MTLQESIALPVTEKVNRKLEIWIASFLEKGFDLRCTIDASHVWLLQTAGERLLKFA